MPSPLSHRERDAIRDLFAPETGSFTPRASRRAEYAASSVSSRSFVGIQALNRRMPLSLKTFRRSVSVPQKFVFPVVSIVFCS